jgi:hypothetical protein
MTLPPRSKHTTSGRLQGELFISSLELFSLFLQHNDTGLQRKVDDLSDAELRVMIRQTSNFYHMLVRKDDRP